MSDPIPSRALALSPHHSVSLLAPLPERPVLVRVSIFLRAPLSFARVSFFTLSGARALNLCDPSVVGRVVFMSSLPAVRPSRASPPTPSRGGSSVELPALPPPPGASEPSRTVTPPISSGGPVAPPPRVEGFVPPAAPSLPPFQKSRGPSGSIGAVDFRPASLGPAPPGGGSGVRQTFEDVPPPNGPVIPRRSASYQPRPGSYGAWGSCRQPGLLPQKTQGILDAGAELADNTRQWFGTAMARSRPLPVASLRFPWRRYARAGITPAELLSRDSLRPDLMRVRRVYEAGRVDEAGLILAWLTGEGGGVPYQIPDAITCDRTFAYTVGEVFYVDCMAEHVVSRAPGAPRRFVLSEFEELYVSPRPYPYSKARMALQKSASSLMRLFGIAVSPHDWATYRHREENDGRVFRSASLEQGITPRDFPELPEVVQESLPSFGVHALLPYALKHFGFACSDPNHPTHADLAHNVERE